MSKPKDYDDVSRLISDLIDGHLEDEEKIRLGIILETDPDARRLYLQMVDQQLEFACQIHSAPANELPENVVPLDLGDELESKRNLPKFLWRVGLAAVAAIAVLFVANIRKDSDGDPIQVTAGTTNRPPDASPAAPTDEFVLIESFESGVPSEWRGTLETNGLPSGSRGAIRATADVSPGGAFHTISLPHDWTQGIVTLGTNTALLARYKLMEPVWINVFMHTFGRDQDAGQSLFLANRSPFLKRTGEWVTVSIPFSVFQRKTVSQSGQPGGFSGGPPEARERMIGLFFSASEQVDFVIDQVRITPNGATNITFVE